MYRYFPMFRAKSLLGGNPIVYDLTELPQVVSILPSYEPIVRDLESVGRVLLRKNFGLRMTVEIQHELIQSQAWNLTARYWEVSGNQLINPDDFIAGLVGGDGWTLQNATVAEDTTPSPLGIMDAWTLTDSDNTQIGLVYQKARPDGSLRSHIGKTALFSCFVRAEVPHTARIDIRANASPDLNVFKDFNARQIWERQQVRNTFDATLTTLRSSWGFIWPAPPGPSATGVINAYRADLREIAAIPGKPDAILWDLFSKFLRDDYEVEMTLDGGLTWRTVLLGSLERAPIEGKTIGLHTTATFQVTDPVENVPPVLDGVW